MTIQEVFQPLGLPFLYAVTIQLKLSTGHRHCLLMLRAVSLVNILLRALRKIRCLALALKNGSFLTPSYSWVSHSSYSATATSRTLHTSYTKYILTLKDDNLLDWSSGWLTHEDPDS